MLIQVRSRDDPQTQGEDKFFFFFLHRYTSILGKTLQFVKSI